MGTAAVPSRKVFLIRSYRQLFFWLADIQKHVFFFFARICDFKKFFFGYCITNAWRHFCCCCCSSHDRCIIWLPMKTSWLKQNKVIVIERWFALDFIICWTRRSLWTAFILAASTSADLILLHYYIEKLVFSTFLFKWRKIISSEENIMSIDY